MAVIVGNARGPAEKVRPIFDTLCHFLDTNHRESVTVLPTNTGTYCSSRCLIVLSVILLEVSDLNRGFHGQLIQGRLLESYSYLNYPIAQSTWFADGLLMSEINH